MFMYSSIQDFIFSVFIRLIVVFTALPIHEFAHGWVANKLGDHTAKNQGRLNLNPFTHFDLIGTTCLLLTGFGWAKPVPVNPFFFKNRKRDMALTALAGPVSNILLATALLIVYKILFFFVPMAFTSQIMSVLMDAFMLMVSLNIGLAVFNLLPVPPLDGSKVIGFFLPERTMNLFYRYERIIAMVLFAVIMFTQLLNYPLSIARNFLLRGLDFITGFIDVIARML